MSPVRSRTRMSEASSIATSNRETFCFQAARRSSPISGSRRRSLRRVGTAGSEPLTQTGMSIGTPAYMAPEQAAGDPNTDHRADIYAFGCLAYEVFSGKPPFEGEAPHRVIAAHFAETPRPITERRAELSPAIAALIAQCLEKDPGRRPQSAAEVLQALDVTSTSQPVVVRRRSPAFVAAGALAIAALVAGAAYLGFRGRATGEAVPPEPLAFAAIPFRNVARDTALDYRADGIRDEILNGMSGVPGIQIVARNAARRYKNLDTLDERAVERQLGARFLVTGTYRQDGGRIFVSAQLSDSMTRGELWSASFETWADRLRLAARRDLEDDRRDTPSALSRALRRSESRHAPRGHDEPGGARAIPHRPGAAEAPWIGSEAGGVELRGGDQARPASSLGRTRRSRLPSCSSRSSTEFR